MWNYNKSQFKGSDHILRSLSLSFWGRVPPATWNPWERLAVVWHPPCFPLAAASNWPACLISPYTFWSLSQSALLGDGLGSAGWRAQIGHGWGLLFSSPMSARRESERGRCVYVPLVAPHFPMRSLDSCPWPILKKAETKGNNKNGKVKCNENCDLTNLLNRNQ